ncbi:MAG: hypothetical protein V1927_06990 [Candidatus Omnitrophota bacterium]
MAKEALELWQGLPADTRRMLLSNVWCGECRKAVTIVDYHAELKGVVVLQGFCGTCGHKVARVIDDLAPAPKNKTKAAMSGLYIFDVWLYGDEKGTDEKKIVRKIQIAGTKSLYNFAKIITQAFGFYFDHCFGFYDNFQRYGHSSMAYELFVDVGEEPLSSASKGVKKIKIGQAFKSTGQKMLFLFDYGDEWRFVVEVKEIKQAEKRDLKPVILESIGKAPLQYPPCEE